jgi:lipase
VSVAALLLLHGTGDSGACWGPFVDQLRSRPGLADLRVGAPDLPHHGSRGRGSNGEASPAATGRNRRTISWQDLVADATELASEFARSTGESIVVGGHSLGARLALHVAATLPDHVAGLFLEDPPLNSSLAADMERRSDAELDLTTIGNWLSDLQTRTPEQLSADVRADHPDWPSAEFEPWVASKLAVNAAAFQDGVRWNRSGWAEQVASVRCPATLVAGEAERGGIVHPDAAGDIGRLPGWTVVSLPTGHDVRREAQLRTVDECAALILRATPRTLAAQPSPGTTDRG